MMRWGNKFPKFNKSSPFLPVYCEKLSSPVYLKPSNPKPVNLSRKKSWWPSWWMVKSAAPKCTLRFPMPTKCCYLDPQIYHKGGSLRQPVGLIPSKTPVVWWSARKNWVLCEELDRSKNIFITFVAPGCSFLGMVCVNMQKLQHPQIPSCSWQVLIFLNKENWRRTKTLGSNFFGVAKNFRMIEVRITRITCLCSY